MQKKRRIVADGGHLDWRNEFHGRLMPARDDNDSWWTQLKKQAGFAPENQRSATAPVNLRERVSELVSADPRQMLAAQNVASAPIASYAPPPPPPVVNQNLTQNVTQNITAETPAELKRATRDGAKDGLTDGGELLRTQRALAIGTGAR